VDTLGWKDLLRSTFDPSTSKGRFGVASAILFVITPQLSAFVSNLFLLLLVPAILMSAIGLRNLHGDRWSRGISRTGLLMTFNGALLIVSLFVLGFVSDFLLVDEESLRLHFVGVGFTTVHLMLGLGLLLMDDSRHEAGDRIGSRDPARP
jgi:hypothetical protein